GGPARPSGPTAPPPPVTEPPRPADPIASPPPGPAPTPPAPQSAEPPAVLPPDFTCPWVLRVEIIKGRTLMTAQTGKEVQFRVSCDKLELQAPRGSIMASGNVTVSSDGLQGSCDQLVIAWQKDQVVLEGKAELKCHRDGQEVDLKAAKLSLRLSIPKTGGDPRGATLLRKDRNAERPRGDGRGSEIPASWNRYDG